MFTNYYEVKLQNERDEEVVAKLRLGIGSQIKLNKKYNNEGTRQTLFASVDDPEKFVSVMDEALKWKGNDNTIRSGEELVDLMICNGMLGVFAQQEIVVQLGRVSGLFSEEEADRLLSSVRDDSKRALTKSTEDDNEKN